MLYFTHYCWNRTSISDYPGQSYPKKLCYSLPAVVTGCSPWVDSLSRSRPRLQTVPQLPWRQTEMSTRLLIDLLVSHQRQLKSISKRLYYFLQPQTKHRIPDPQVHNSFLRILPMIPIISHSNSLLSHSAQQRDSAQSKWPIDRVKYYKKRTPLPPIRAERREAESAR